MPESSVSGGLPSAAGEELDGEPLAIGDLLYRLAARYEGFFVVLLLVVFLCGAAIKGHHKTLWYDEIFTAFVAMQPDWHHFALAMPAEGNPPLHTAMAWVFIRLFGLSAFSIRLPELLGLLGALVGIFVFVRRECGAVYGLLAMLLFLSQPAWKYSYEARPYGLLMGFMMLALVAWQSAARAADIEPRRSRALACCGMVVGIVGCILSHNIGVVEIGIPLVFGEAVRTYKRRRLDWPVLATALSVIPAMLITVPMIGRTNKLLLENVRVITLPLTLHKLIDYTSRIGSTSGLVFDKGVLGFLVLVLFLVWIPRVFQRAHGSNADRLTSAPRKIPAYIAAAAIGALLLLPITWLALIPGGGWYFCRYGIGVLVGVAILTCTLLAGQSVRRPVIVVLLMAISAASYLRSVKQDRPENPIEPGALNFITEDTSGLPIVVSDPFVYPALWWYAPATKKNNVVYLRSSVRANPNYELSETALIAEKPVIDAPLADFDTFTATHDHFLLEDNYFTTPDMKARLESQGFTTTQIKSGPGWNGYDVQRTRR